MTMRRAAAAAIAVILSIGTLSCATQGPDDDTPTPGPTSSSNDKRKEAAFPEEPKVAIEWQNTVVDVEPTSRFQDSPGGPDTAHVTTELALAKEPDDDTKTFFEDLDGVEVVFDGKLVRMRYAFDVEESDENRYSFEFEAPIEFAELEHGDDVSVVVLLPREASEYEDVPTYDIRLDEKFAESAPDYLDIKEAKESPGNRITIGLYEKTDPKIGPIYIYLP